MQLTPTFISLKFNTNVTVPNMVENGIIIKIPEI